MCVRQLKYSPATPRMQDNLFDFGFSILDFGLAGKERSLWVVRCPLPVETPNPRSRFPVPDSLLPTRYCLLRSRFGLAFLIDEAYVEDMQTGGEMTPPGLHLTR